MTFDQKLFSGLLTICLSTFAFGDVRVLHLSPDAPNVDVLVGASEDTKAGLLSDFAYKDVSPYVPLATGSYFIDVNVAGTTTTVIDVNDLAVDGDTFYSIAAVNVVSAIEPLVLVDDNTIDPSNARLRVVHASPDAGAVDVAVRGVGTVLSGFEFKSASDYFVLPPGDYTVDIFEAGGADPIFTVPGLALEAGTVYSAFAAGLVGGQGTEAFMVLPTVDAVPEPGTWSIMLIGMLFCIRRFRRR